MVRTELFRAAVGMLLLMLGLAVPTVPAMAIRARAPVSIAQQDQGSMPQSLYESLDAITIPTDLTLEEKDSLKFLFGPEALRKIETASTNSYSPTSLSVDVLPHRVDLGPRASGFLRWLQKRQQKKSLEKQLMEFLENQEKLLSEQIDAVKERNLILQRQLNMNYEQYELFLRHQTALKRQKEVFNQLKAMPSLYHDSPSGHEYGPFLVTPTGSLSGTGTPTFTMSGPMIVVANQDAPHTETVQVEETENVLAAQRTPAATPATPTNTGAGDQVLTVGVPESLSQFARSFGQANVLTSE